MAAGCRVVSAAVSQQYVFADEDRREEEEEKEEEAPNRVRDRAPKCGVAAIVYPGSVRPFRRVWTLPRLSVTRVFWPRTRSATTGRWPRPVSGPAVVTRTDRTAVRRTSPSGPPSTNTSDTGTYIGFRLGSLHAGRLRVLKSEK